MLEEDVCKKQVEKEAAKARSNAVVCVLVDTAMENISTNKFDAL